jgi:hypothetical protein
VRVVVETFEEALTNVFVNVGVVRDLFLPGGRLGFGRKFSVVEEVGDF